MHGWLHETRETAGLRYLVRTGRVVFVRLVAERNPEIVLFPCLGSNPFVFVTVLHEISLMIEVLNMYYIKFVREPSGTRKTAAEGLVMLWRQERACTVMLREPAQQ